MIGTSLNQYRITASIGAGGKGEVSLARFAIVISYAFEFGRYGH